MATTTNNMITPSMKYKLINKSSLRKLPDEMIRNIFAFLDCEDSILKNLFHRVSRMSSLADLTPSWRNSCFVSRYFLRVAGTTITILNRDAETMLVRKKIYEDIKSRHSTDLEISQELFEQANNNYKIINVNIKTFINSDSATNPSDLYDRLEWSINRGLWTWTFNETHFEAQYDEEHENDPNPNQLLIDYDSDDYYEPPLWLEIGEEQRELYRQEVRRDRFIGHLEIYRHLKSKKLWSLPLEDLYRIWREL
jgi:hypothetical protein